MAKLTGLERHILVEGLKMYSTALKKEIKQAKKKGKNHIFTDAYVEITSREIEEKLKTLTLK
jgi:hypothetical protein